MGKDKWRSHVKSGYFDQFDMEETVTLQETEMAGDWGFARGTFIFRGTPKGGGETVELLDKYIAILMRQTHGDWKISRLIWNTENPLSEEPPI